MSLAGAIDSLATGTYVVTRRAATTYTDGKTVAGSTSTFSVRAVAVPVSGRELERLPEAWRAREVFRLFTREELRTVVPGSADPDLVAIDGFTWEVSRVLRWNVPGQVDYYESYLTKVGPRS